MTIRLRKLPKAVGILLLVCVAFIWLVFLINPLGILVTNRIESGRVVRADSSGASILIHNKAYPVSNDCIDMNKQGACEFVEGKTELVLVNDNGKDGRRLDQTLLLILFGIAASALLFWLLTEVKIQKPEPKSEPTLASEPELEAKPSAVHHRHEE